MRAGASFAAACWRAMSSAGLWTAATVALSGCGSGSAWELDLTVRIPATVFDGYTGEYPAQIIVAADVAPPDDPASDGGTAYRIANVCSKPKDAMTYQATWSGSACDAPRYLRAWLEPRDVGAESKCGSIDPPSELTGAHRPPGTGSPRGEAAGFDDACGVDEKDVTITLSFRR